LNKIYLQFGIFSKLKHLENFEKEEILKFPQGVQPYLLEGYGWLHFPLHAVRLPN